MEVPDKIYVAIDSELGFMNTKTAIAFSSEQKFNTAEYIRKDALLEWAKSMKRICKGAEPIEKAYQTMINKIESL